MAFHPFKKKKVSLGETPTADDFNTAQDYIESALAQLLGKDTLDQVLIKNVLLLPGIINKVPHKLGRVLNGYTPVRNHGGYAILTDLQDTNPSPHLLLYLTTPVQVTVDLLVF